MFIEVMRSGGVAGMTRRACVEVDSHADDAHAREWRTLVERARPFLAAQPVDSEAQYPDGFVWTVSVDDTTCRVADSSIEGPLREIAHRALREGRRL